jgi:hypothetical protein
LLFNLKEDPWETNDLSAHPDYVSVLTEMDRILAEEWEKRIKPGTHFDRN